MGEVLRRSFGDQINYDDGTDPVVQRLKFFSNSPHPWYRGLHEQARGFNRSRRAALDLLSVADSFDPESTVPGTAAYAHAEWMRSIRYNPETYEILDPGPSPEIRTHSHETHADLKATLDEGEGGSASPRSNVLQFPSSSADSTAAGS